MRLHQFIIKMESSFFTAKWRENLNKMDAANPSWKAVRSSDVHFCAVRAYVVAHSPCCLPLALIPHERGWRVKADSPSTTSQPSPSSHAHRARAPTLVRMHLGFPILPHIIDSFESATAGEF